MQNLGCTYLPVLVLGGGVTMAGEDAVDVLTVTEEGEGVVNVS